MNIEDKENLKIRMINGGRLEGESCREVFEVDEILPVVWYRMRDRS